MHPSVDLDRLLTLKAAAELLGIPYFKVQRAAARRLIPTYTLLNSRKYVRPSEILAQMAMVSTDDVHSS